jgi:flagellar protein FlbD
MYTNMIRITRLNRTPLILNSDLIEHIEMTPDTVIALTSGQKYMVLETTEEIIERVVSFRQSLLRNQPPDSKPVSAEKPAVGVASGEPRTDG